MIKGDNITRYEDNNKIYVPILNNNYKYTINGDEITIITNENCRTQYQTTYCNCYRYNERYNIITEPYECNNNPSNYIINVNNLTNDINDSYRIANDFTRDYIIYFGIIIIALIFSIMLKKNSIKI